MLTLEEMILRFVAALALGALLGVERELVRKEAGVRTEMLVAGGASIFAMVGLALPYIAASMSGSAVNLAAQTNSFGIIANIVVGIGFLGAGLIIKMNDHPHGVTTAALVWTTAAVGVLAGIGMAAFAAIATVIIVILLYILRKTNISEQLEKQSESMQLKPAAKKK
jgi:putative Mg2+ transporter-C (MgtC) family protein